MIKLSQTATWNSSLTNPYRTRYATAGGRYFKVSAQHLNDMWAVEEINEDGSMYAVVLHPEVPVWERTAEDIDFGLFEHVFTLAQAREAIAKAVGE